MQAFTILLAPPVRQMLAFTILLAPPVRQMLAFTILLVWCGGVDQPKFAKIGGPKVGYASADLHPAGSGRAGPGRVEETQISFLPSANSRPGKKYAVRENPSLR